MCRGILTHFYCYLRISYLRIFVSLSALLRAFVVRKVRKARGMPETLLEALVTGQKQSGNSLSLGRWGAPTGTIDWCEANYVSTSLVAELHNTWSNVFYVIVGTAALVAVRRQRLPVQFAACGTLIVFTGIFSALFHATLQLFMQRLDEIFENGILIAMLHSDRGQHAMLATMLHFFLCAGLILAIRQFLFCELHLVGIILLVLAKFGRLSCKQPAVVPLVRTSALLTVAGFSAWLLDRLFCDSLQNLNLHAFWHFFTALALWWGFQAVALVHIATSNRRSSKCK